MHRGIKELKGSRSRDNFKRWHKTLNREWYACDLDLVLLTRSKILAIIDFKKNSDEITWSEEIVYSDLLSKSYEVYIVKGDSSKNLKIFKYLRKGSIKLAGEDYVQWEKDLRDK